MSGPVSVSVLTFNCYLLPRLFANRHNASCDGQQKRAKGTAQLMHDRKVDIACLQEVWGSHSWNLEDGLRDKFGILYPSWGSTFLDSWRNYWLQRGGLQLLWREQPDIVNVDSSCSNDDLTNSEAVGAKQSLRLLDSTKHTYQTSISMSRKGCLGCLFKILATEHECGNNVSETEPPTGDYLMVFQTHLDYLNFKDSQVKQLYELRDFIASTLDNAKERHNIESCQLSVIICGDMNIDGGFHQPYSHPTFDASCNGGSLRPRGDLGHKRSLDFARRFSHTVTSDGKPLYDAMLEILGDARDLHREYVTNSPDGKERLAPTYVFGENSLVMYDWTRRLDFILTLDRHPNEEKPLKPIRVKHVEVVRQSHGSELSDHWPVIAELLLG